VNADDDPVIFENLKKPQELIFSNVLQGPDNNPYWLGMGEETPDHGKNHHGDWKKGDKDENGKEVPIAHPNSRYTICSTEAGTAIPQYLWRNPIPTPAVFF